MIDRSKMDAVEFDSDDQGCSVVVVWLAAAVVVLAIWAVIALVANQIEQGVPHGEVVEVGE